MARDEVASGWRRTAPSGEGHATDQRGRSLVDSAEEALHNWLAGGRYRQGDRLPPEQEVATMLGISRGTLRSALHRLEERGEIVRRQGSGTSTDDTKAIEARSPSAARPAASPSSGPRAGRSSVTTSTDAGSGGSSWPAAATTTTGPPTDRRTIPRTRRRSVEPCQSSAAFGVPILEDRPPVSTIPPTFCTT